MTTETRGRAMIRIPRDLLEELAELARRNDRSATAELRVAVRNHLARSGSAKQQQAVYEDAIEWAASQAFEPDSRRA